MSSSDWQEIFSPFGLGVLDLAVARYVYDEVAAAGELREIPGFFAGTADRAPLQMPGGAISLRYPGDPPHPDGTTRAPPRRDRRAGGSFAPAATGRVQ